MSVWNHSSCQSHEDQEEDRRQFPHGCPVHQEFTGFRQLSPGPLSVSSGNAACSPDKQPTQRHEPSQPCSLEYHPEHKERHKHRLCLSFQLVVTFFLLLFQHTAFKYLTTVTGWVVSSNFYCFFGDYDEGLQRLTGKTSRVVVCGYFMPAPSLPKSQSSPPEPQKNALINHPSANP